MKTEQTKQAAPLPAEDYKPSKIKDFFYRMKYNLEHFWQRHIIRENGYTKHFDSEVKIIEKGIDKDDSYLLKGMIPAIKNLLLAFGDEGHSGASAGYAIPVLAETIKKVLNFEALTPIQENDEFMFVDGTMFQCKRNSAVFRDSKGTSYLYGIIWSGEEDYDTFTGSVQGIRSSVYMRLPCTPKSFYIDVKKVPGKDKLTDDYYEDDDKNKFHYEIVDKKQLDEVYEYYNKGK